MKTFLKVAIVFLFTLLVGVALYAGSRPFVEEEVLPLTDAPLKIDILENEQGIHLRIIDVQYGIYCLGVNAETVPLSCIQLDLASQTSDPFFFSPQRNDDVHHVELARAGTSRDTYQGDGE